MMPPAPSHPRIVIVEDSLLITLALQDVCDSVGWTLVGRAVTLTCGLRRGPAEAIDAVLLDVEIGEGQSFGIANVLQQRGIPFAFTNGHSAESVWPARFSDAPILRKPFRMAGVKQLINTLLAGTASSSQPI